MPASSIQQAFTLVRFVGKPSNLTGIAQVVSARQAKDVVASWKAEYPDDETVVFDLENQPVDAALLATLALSDVTGETQH
jgi:FMN-dependent NADH-azoreductase